MNWLWTLIEVVDGTWGMNSVMITTVPVAILMCALQLVLAAREVEAVRMETPVRVRRDQDQLESATYQ